ncbi:Xyloglucanase precursor [Streptomyces sp. ADI92-24]|nr:Xyloglucanase precursor [Streptomyces sp. ADI92-24]
MPGRGMGERLAVDPNKNSVLYLGAPSGNGDSSDGDGGGTGPGTDPGPDPGNPPEGGADRAGGSDPCRSSPSEGASEGG